MEERLITLARTLAKALTDFADELAAMSGNAAAAPARRMPNVRGPRQLEIVKLLIPAGLEGLTTREIANAIDRFPSNTWNTLRALERAGHVQQIAGAYPQRWRTT